MYFFNNQLQRLTSLFNVEGVSVVLRRFPVDSLDVPPGDIVCGLGVDQFELHNSSSLALAFFINESVF